ncbi:unnamed protein product [Owenia fusiformis]|uniref:Gamma-aminobutyric acid type B receptor subunit 2 n=1 Tax=Owenia fusiformis TaxID=6347 RepID=A0A8S4PNJ2_OWEFU|nr:unnamed protein product [Owenia fusiformis]
MELTQTFKKLQTIIYILFVSLARQCESKKTIHIGGICIMSNHWWFHAKTFPYVIQSAFEDINNATWILPNYDLQLHMKDSQGSPGLGIKALYEFVHEPPVKTMLIGPAKSEIAVAVSQAAPVWNLVSLLYSAKATTLNNRKQFPNIYRMNFNERSFNPVRVAIMKEFGWARVATLTIQEEPYVSQMDDFHNQLAAEGMTLVSAGVLTASDDDYIAGQVKTLKQYDARIIVANINDLYVRQVFCEAYKIGITGDKYVWMLMNWAATPGWPVKTQPIYGVAPNSSCSVEELYTAAEGYIGMEQKYLSESSEKTISGMTPSEINDRAWSRYSKYIDDGELSLSHTYAYDSGWAIALALQAAIPKLAMINKTLEDFSYDDSTMADIFKECLEDLSYFGSSGPVAFDSSGTRVGITYLYRWANRSNREIGYFDGQTNLLNWYSPLKWKGGSPPLDSFIRKDVELMLPVGVAISFITLAILGLGFAVCLLIFNIRNRKMQMIKMSSPNLNNMLLVGAMAIYGAVVVGAFDVRLVPLDGITVLCNAQTWIVTIAFTLAFGCMFTKTWRVHVLFTNQKLEKKVVKDSQLFGMVGVLILVDVLILTTWTIVDPLKASSFIMDEELDETNDDLIIIPHYTECQSKHSLWWLLTLYCYKGLLLIIGSLLAWETRKVTIPGLNDSKIIGMCVYNITVLSAFSVPITHLLTDAQFLTRFCLISSLMIVCTTTTLLILFVPKVMMRSQNVKVGNFSLGGGTSANHTKPTGSALGNGSRMNLKVPKVPKMDNDLQLADVTSMGPNGLTDEVSTPKSTRMTNIGSVTT